jgi:hypothetical protein
VNHIVVTLTLREVKAGTCNLTGASRKSPPLRIHLSSVLEIPCGAVDLSDDFYVISMLRFSGGQAFSVGLTTVSGP